MYSVLGHTVPHTSMYFDSALASVSSTLDKAGDFMHHSTVYEIVLNSVGVTA